MDQSLLTPAPTTAEPRFSRTAIVGAAWVPLFFILVPLFLMPIRVSVVPGSPPPGPAWWQVLLSLTVLPLGVTAPFGTTILGGIAISQIRHSRGRLYGLGLAVFDALLFPLLALDALILSAVLFGLRFSAVPAVGEMVRPWISYWWVWLAALGTIAVVDWLVVRAVWRMANRPAGS